MSGEPHNLDSVSSKQLSHNHGSSLPYQPHRSSVPHITVTDHSFPPISSGSDPNSQDGVLYSTDCQGNGPAASTIVGGAEAHRRRPDSKRKIQQEHDYLQPKAKRTLNRDLRYVPEDIDYSLRTYVLGPSPAPAPRVWLFEHYQQLDTVPEDIQDDGNRYLGECAQRHKTLDRLEFDLEEQMSHDTGLMYDRDRSGQATMTASRGTHGNPSYCTQGVEACIQAQNETDT